MVIGGSTAPPTAVDSGDTHDAAGQPRSKPNVMVAAGNARDPRRARVTAAAGGGSDDTTGRA
jgi:hypothetical protein